MAGIGLTKSYFTMYSGDSKLLNIPVVDENGVALDVTGAEFTYAYKNIDTGVITNKAVTITDAKNGMVQVSLEPSDTTITAEAVILKHELQMVDIVGEVSTILSGYIIVVNDLV